MKTLSFEDVHLSVDAFDALCSSDFIDSAVCNVDWTHDAFVIQPFYLLRSAELVEPLNEDVGDVYDEVEVGHSARVCAFCKPEGEG